MTQGRNLLLTAKCSAALLAAQALFSGASVASDFAYSANLGVGHSDNIRRVETNKEGEDIATAGVRFSVDERSPRLTADVFGDLAYYDYLDNTFDSQVTGNFSGNAQFAIVPERLQWVLSDNFGQVLNDPFTPATPDNLENINSFSTGPRLTLALGSQNRLRLGALYTKTTYEDSPLDSDSVGGDLGLVRLLSAASSLSLNARYQQVDYDNAALDADYNQSDAFLRYETKGARTQLSVDAGYTAVDRDATTSSEDSPLLRLSVIRRVSASSTATLTAGREFSSSGGAFAGTPTVGTPVLGPGVTPGRQTAEPFTNNNASIGWTFARARTHFSLFGSWSDQSYESDSALDQTLTTLGAQFRRELSQRTSLEIAGQFGHGKFDQPGADYDDLNGGVTFAWRLTRRVSVDASYNYFKRDSDLAGGSFNENRFWLSISYGKGDPRNTPALPEFSVDQGT